MRDEARRAELAGNLAKVRSRIAAACEAVGRDRSEITLVAVAKTFPVSDVGHLVGLGVRDIGENRDAEAADKVAQAADHGLDVRWHFVGRLQRNKARSVAGYAHMVHSVDTERLAQALGAAAEHRESPLDVLVQVSIDGDAKRGGAADPGLVAASIAAHPALKLRGVMAVAPLDWDPAEAFARLAELAAQVRAEHPGASVISAGMTGDLEPAIRYGATHVRIGSALLGPRAPLG